MAWYRFTDCCVQSFQRVHRRDACQWDSESTRSIHAEESFELVVEEFDFSRTHVVHEANGVMITAFPVVHALSGAVGYRAPPWTC
jgi:ribonuclease Z